MHERNDRRDDDLAIRDAKEGVSPTLIGLIVVAILAVIFVVQNQEDTKIKFLFFTFNTAVWTAIVIALILGAVLGWLALTAARYRRRR